MEEIRKEVQMRAEQKSAFQEKCEPICEFVLNAVVENRLAKVTKCVVNSVVSSTIKSNINSNNFGHSGHVQNIHDVKRNTQGNFDKVASIFDDNLQEHAIKPVCKTTCKQLDEAIDNPGAYARKQMENFTSFSNQSFNNINQSFNNINQSLSIPTMSPAEAFDFSNSLTGSGGTMFNAFSTDFKWH
ncbi:MAG: hypothetical protein U1E31_02335 [Rickettsiales bacterium]